MSVITRHPSGGDAGAGKLAATLLSVTVAGMADPARFRRGKAYVLDDAVLRIEVRPGVLRAQVLGSRPEPYRATVSVDAAPRPADLAGDRVERHHVVALCPEPDAMVASCTCPDFDDPCKHAVAALLVFAQELASRPQLLVEWRCGRAEAPRRAAGWRATTGRHLHLVGAGQRPAADPYAGDEWAAFLGVHLAAPDVATVLAELPALQSGAATVGSVDLGALVRSAQSRLRT